eukprot:1179636-Prorocentrum_minimum.AAC.3
MQPLLNIGDGDGRRGGGQGERGVCGGAVWGVCGGAGMDWSPLPPIGPPPGIYLFLTCDWLPLQAKVSREMAAAACVAAKAAAEEATGIMAAAQKTSTMSQ